MEIESHGHACALLILGREELGKAFIYHNVASDELLADVAKDLIKAHTKTGKAHIYKLLQFRFLSALNEASENKTSAQNAMSEFSEGLRAFDEEDIEKQQEELAKLGAKEKETNKLKMNALYVDTTELSIMTPLDSKFKEIAPRLLTELKRLLDFVVNVIFKPL